MAFVHHEMSIIGHDIGYLTLPHQTLDGCDVDETCRPFPSAPNDSNASGVDIEKGAQPLYPLIQQLLPVHQNQRVRVSLGYEPACDHGLTEGGRGREHSGVVRHESIRGFLLLRGECSKKARSKSYATNPLVQQFSVDTAGG